MVNTRKLTDNLVSIRQRIGEAAKRSGRAIDDITLIAVTKYVDAEHCTALFDAGCQHLGESRPQSLWEKAEQLKDLQPTWHMIGHLQRNKVKRTIPIASLIHSADSHRLLKEMDLCASQQPRPSNVLLEINVSSDSEKHGFHPQETEDVLCRLSEFSHIQVTGLMGMASRGGDHEQARREFAALRELREQWSSQHPEIDLTQLSMGMSNDFEVAIEEGATMVRVGSALFRDLD